MSLVSFALRLIASRVIRDQTWAGSMVFNSPIDPLAEWSEKIKQGESQPCIALYTGKARSTVIGKQDQGSSSQIDLILNIFVPPTAIEAKPEEGEEPAITLETNNTGGAMVIDFIARQISASLRFGDPVWVDLWKNFVVSIEGVSSRPLLYQVEGGVSVPCVEFTYTLKAIPEPDFGVELLPYWAALKSAMLADSDYAASAPLLDMLINEPSGLSDWQKAQAMMGISENSFDALGLRPADITAQDDGEIVTDISFTDDPDL